MNLSCAAVFTCERQILSWHFLEFMSEKWLHCGGEQKTFIRKLSYAIQTNTLDLFFYSLSCSHHKSVCSCLLSLLTDICKDMLAATGNYAQPEVTTLTWRWLATRRKKSGHPRWSPSCAEIHPDFFSVLNCRPNSFSQDKVLLFSLVSVIHPGPCGAAKQICHRCTHLHVSDHFACMHDLLL